MSFQAFRGESIERLIAQAAEARKLTVMVGAGASMESGLPSWEQLVDRLVVRAGRESNLMDDDQPTAEQRWAREVSRDGPTGAAEIVDALVGSQRDSLLEEELFGPDNGPDGYVPGQISLQIARLRREFGTDLRILTTNYDDLIEQALRISGDTEPCAIATHDHRCGANQTEVFHLHGYLGRDGRPKGKLILSESDYQEMQRGSSWQEQLVSSAMRDSTFLFVGTSLADPNMLRYLHHVERSTGIPKFAVFVRQGTYDKGVDPRIIKARETALTARWSSVGVEPIFVDHFQDVAQLLYEIGLARQQDGGYVPLPQRGQSWIDTIRRDLLGFDDDNRFVTAQRVIVEQLREALRAAIEVAESLENRRWSETIGMSMWLVDRDGTHLTNWVTTDRIHIDRNTVEPVKIDEHAKWVAVRTFCQGLPLAEQRDIYASRWHFIRSLPLIVDTPPAGRLPVGCLTISSIKGHQDTMLNVMEDTVESAFNEALKRSVLNLLHQPFLEMSENAETGAKLQS